MVRSAPPPLPFDLPAAPARPTRTAPPALPTDRPAGEVRHPGFTGRPTAYQPSPVSAVKAMQQAILDFGNVLAQNYLMGADAPTTSKRLPGGTLQFQTEIGPEPKAPGGSDPFGNFLVNHYLNNEKVVGKQFINTDLQEPLRSGTALRPNISLRGVVNTIQRIGVPGTENKPDGVWQTRTNNALRQIAAVAQTLLQLQKDLGLDIAGYTSQDAKALMEAIPQSYTQLGDTAEKRATIITPNLKKLTEFYQQFEKLFLNNPEYKAIITQNKSLVSHPKAIPLAPEQQLFTQRYGTTPLPGVFITGKSPQAVSLQYLTSPERFQQLLESAGVPNPQDLETQRRALEAIKKQLAAAFQTDVAKPVGGK